MKKTDGKLIVGLTVFLLGMAGAAGAQKGPNIPEMKPGKYDYSMEMNNPAIPFKMPAMKFSHCVASKDLEEGRAFQTQRDAGVECNYSNMKSTPGAFQFNAMCKMKGGMTMDAVYDGKIVGGTITINVKQKMVGGDMPDAMRNSTTKMVMTRVGDC